MRVLLMVACVVMLAGCGYANQCSKYHQSNLDEESTVTVGSAIVSSGCIQLREDPRALTRLIFGRGSVIIEGYESTTLNEILYSGRNGDTVHVTYREYTYDGYARTPFFQQLFYDMKTSNRIVFKDWVINVIDANNESIKFKVTKEPKLPKIPPPTEARKLFK